MELQGLELRAWVRVCGWLEGVSEGFSECRGRALGGGVGAGPRLCAAGGSLGGRGFMPGSPTGSPVPRQAGKVLAVLPSVPPPS